MLRVVLDANLLTSAVLTPLGEARALLRRARVDYELLLSDFMHARLAQVLHYPHIQTKYPHLTSGVITEYLALLRGLALFVPEKTETTASKDPEDNRVLAVAVDGQADYLVTRNHSHFPATYGQIKIVSPADFRSHLQGAQDR
ncbi:MAG: putative toxin-antitoxin system toxin component, PIN family [Candidatus Latescibacteria bacterium]|nr:putative toxin-antitoxin system toxin component, PIN family [Candidatus Latescibacterota bacterium]